jgi:hypothetical protein
MGRWLWVTHGFRLRDVIVVLTLVSHLMLTFGIPLPAPSRKKPTDGVPYPCQSRPCGCVTAEQCWAGDCCCFSIEEKLAWAEANGVEPPEHVRRLLVVAGRDCRRHRGVVTRHLQRAEAPTGERRREVSQRRMHDRMPVRSRGW